MHDAGFGGVVVVAVELVVMQALGCAIGRRCYRAPSGRTANHLGREVVDRYLIGSGTFAAEPTLTAAAQIMQ